MDYEGLQLDTRARDNRDPQLDLSKPQGLLNDNYNPYGCYPNDENQAHAGIPVGVPMGIPASSEGTLSPMSPMGPKELDEGLNSSRPQEKRICGLRQKHFWELLGLIVAIVLAAAIVGGVVGGLPTRKGKSSPSGQPAYNTTKSANNTNSLPLQWVHFICSQEQLDD